MGHVDVQVKACRTSFSDADKTVTVCRGWMRVCGGNESKRFAPLACDVYLPLPTVAKGMDRSKSPEGHPSHCFSSAMLVHQRSPTPLRSGARDQAKKTPQEVGV